jgi:hypothetical protein
MAHAKPAFSGKHRNLSANEASGNIGCVNWAACVQCRFYAADAKFVLKLSEINMEINNLRRN